MKFSIVWINQTTMKVLYNNYIEPDVYYCNKCEIIVHNIIRILYNLVNAIITTMSKSVRNIKAQTTALNRAIT